MWPVYELDLLLPVGMHVYEDADTVLFKCLWCGAEVRYHRHGPGADKILSDAHKHRERCLVRAEAVKTVGPLDD